MSTTHINRLRCSITNTPGLAGNVVVGAATSAARRTFTATEDGKSFEPTFEDGTAWETRTGCVYTHSTATLTRGTLVDSSTGSAIALTSSAVVTLGPTAKQMTDLEPVRSLASGKILGRSTAGSGSPEEIAVGSGLALAGGVLAATGGAGYSPPGIFYADQNGVLPTGADMSAALVALLLTAYAAGGGEIRFGPGVYRFDSQITLPYNGVALSPKGVPITFVGVGEWWSGKGSPNANPANGGTIFDCRYTGSDAWLMCLHEGTFGCRQVTFSQRGGSAHTTPYIKTTNTTLMIERCSFEGHSTKAAATANQDCIILGGTNDASFGGNNVDAPFQGYGTVIERNNFNRIRRGVFGRVYANGVVVRNNQWWAQCGDSGVGAGAIEFDSGNINYCVGGDISGNLIECVGYLKPIKLVRCSQMTLVSNSFYDQPGVTTGLVDVTLCNNLVIVGGAFDDVMGPYVSDVAQCNCALLAAPTTPVTLQFVHAGKPGFPNVFKDTTFTAVGATVFQSAAAIGSGTTPIVAMKRSAAEGTGANENIWSIGYDGNISWGGANSPKQGEITTTLAAATSWADNGRTWKCNGTGGTMQIWSGTGGSYLELKNYGTKILGHTGTLQMTLGGGKNGAVYGAASDANWERGAVAMMISDVPIRGKSDLLANMPTPTANFKGGHAFATNGRKSGEGAGAGTGIPVWCDGTNWRTYYDNSIAAA